MWWLRPPLLPPLVGGEKREQGAQEILWFGEGGLAQNGLWDSEPEGEGSWHFPSAGPAC